MQRLFVQAGALGLLLIALAAGAQERPAVQVSLSDYPPIFVERYEQAVAANADDEAKVAIWATQKEAAELLGKQVGDAELKAKVLAAWPRYAQSAEALKKGFQGLQPSPVDAMNRINGALGMNKALKLNFVAYAGLFDGTVASTIEEGVASLYVPVEQGGGAVSPAIAREYARIAIQRMAPSLGGRNLAEIAVHEGLALLINGIKPQLASNQSSVIGKYLGGTGSTGIPNEAVYAGKLVVERWLKTGLTIKEILNTPRADMARSAGRVMDVIAKK